MYPPQYTSLAQEDDDPEASDGKGGASRPVDPVPDVSEPVVPKSTTSGESTGTFEILAFFAALFGLVAFAGAVILFISVIVRLSDEITTPQWKRPTPRTVTETVTYTERLGVKSKRAVEAGGDEAEYSTSTLRDGSTQTFVFTTRPIVNPGGYTIGTLTGYVPVSATTTTSTVTTVPTNSALSTSPTASPTSSGGASAAQSWQLVSTPSTTAAYAAATTPVSTGAESVNRLVRRQIEFDFAEVDYHLQHRRGLDFEDDDSTGSATPVVVDDPVSSTPTLSPTSTSSVEGEAEYSTSTDRSGNVYTLVKTTRPIRNPAGYTIGTLDGAWVDVAKQTATPTPKPVHEELKKRSIGAS